jgi:serine/threonine protein kinase
MATPSDQPVIRRCPNSDPGRMRRSLPPELLMSAVRRLRLLAFVLLGMFVLYMVVTAIWPMAGMTPPSWAPHGIDNLDHVLRAIGLFGMVTAALMIGVTYSRKLRPQQILGIGLFFQILGALVISITDFTMPWPEGEIPRGIPAATLWIMAFPLVPSTKPRSLVAAFGAAAMGPLSLGFAVLEGVQVPIASTAIMYYLPLFIGAFIATLASTVIYHLAIDVSQARRLGSYELVEKLGEGGMGEVWRARHGSLARPAAVKVIRPEILGARSAGDTAKILARFEREAQSTASLRSPNTVALYDFGRTSDGTIYYVMELLGGVDLDTLVQRYGPQPAERVVHLLTQVCHSLREAHGMGLIHRDIKPENLQVTLQSGDFDVVKVLDFGLVKRIDDNKDEKVTGELAMLGTPAYVAPEQAVGKGGVDERTDLYALGCVAYYLLTGRFVFSGQTPMEVVLGHVHKEPEPPSQRTHLDVPPELERLIMDLLAKDPSARPASATEVARRLAEVPLATPWSASRAETWWRENMPEAIDRCRATAQVIGTTPATEASPSRQPTVIIPAPREVAAARPQL